MTILNTFTPAASPLKTIVVLGASYAGHRAIQVLLSALPPTHRLVVIERNTHANHLYAFPRMSVVSGHEHKVFIPYTNIFKPALDRRDQHLLLHANVRQVDTANKRVVYSPVGSEEAQSIDWDYLIYALGSHLPDPINVWSQQAQYDGTKLAGVKWLQQAQQRIKAASSILVVGGGALGVQLASDIAVTYGSTKKVTLTHSRPQILSRFKLWMHEKAAARLEELGVDLVLGSRVDLSSVSGDRKSLRLLDGQELKADLILFCLGQTPNTSLLSADMLTESGMIRVLPTMQVQGYPNIFAVGDAADAFGAINAGHTAWDQAEVAANNILRLISASDKELHHYKPTPPAIKVSLGIDRAIRQTMDGQLIEVHSGEIDLNSTTMWTRRGLGTDNLYL